MYQLTSFSVQTRRNREREREREREWWRFQVCSSTEPRHGESPYGVHGLWRVEWNCWECWECHISAPGTPILHRVRTPGVGCASGSAADFDGLRVTFCGVFKQSGTAFASASVQYIYEPTVHLTGSDSCLSAWGGQAAIVGVTEIALPCSRSDSYL